MSKMLANPEIFENRKHEIHRISVPLKMHQIPFSETSDMKTDTYSAII